MDSAEISSQQWLIVLMGVVGSGKSTLSTALVRQIPGWCRVCQDDLGDRYACETMVKAALAQGKSVVIDRQNFDVQQRRSWLEIASAFPQVRVGGWVLGTHPDECARRLRIRQNHPTIHDSQLALELLDKFLGLWVRPDINEGFDHLITLPTLPPAQEITGELLIRLLVSLAESPRNPLGVQQRQPRPRRGYIPHATRSSEFAPNRITPGPRQPPITAWLDRSGQQQVRVEPSTASTRPAFNSWSNGPPSTQGWSHGRSTNNDHSVDTGPRRRVVEDIS